MKISVAEDDVSLSALWTETMKLVEAGGDDVNQFVNEVFISAEKCFDSIVVQFAEEKNFYVIPHYPFERLPKIEGIQSESISQKWKEDAIDRIYKKEPKECHKIICIYGEFSDTDTIKYALEKDFNVSIICGPRLLKDKYKLEIKDFMVKNPDKINIQISIKRPDQHAVFIGNRHLLLEEKHNVGEFYKYAYIIEDISERGKALIGSEFDKLLPMTKKATVDLIDAMELYPYIP